MSSVSDHSLYHDPKPVVDTSGNINISLLPLIRLLRAPNASSSFLTFLPVQSVQDLCLPRACPALLTSEFEEGPAMSGYYPRYLHVYHHTHLLLLAPCNLSIRSIEPVVLSLHNTQLFSLLQMTECDSHVCDHSAFETRKKNAERERWISRFAPMSLCADLDDIDNSC
jgi:hypothetical protein